MTTVETTQNPTIETTQNPTIETTQNHLYDTLNPPNVVHYMQDEISDILAEANAMNFIAISIPLHDCEITNTPTQQIREAVLELTNFMAEIVRFYNESCSYVDKPQEELNISMVNELNALLLQTQTSRELMVDKFKEIIELFYGGTPNGKDAWKRTWMLKRQLQNSTHKCIEYMGNFGDRFDENVVPKIE